MKHEAIKNRFEGVLPAFDRYIGIDYLIEIRAGAAKSVFHFDVPGSVAKSTHAGLPWLRYLRLNLRTWIHFWPFDGWDIPAGRSVVAEVYPVLWSRSFSREGRTAADQHDAFSVVAWIRRADLDGTLSEFFKPSLTPSEHAIAQIEGWILGIKYNSDTVGPLSRLPDGSGRGRCPGDHSGIHGPGII
jgi:hypothetical protein